MYKNYIKDMKQYSKTISTSFDFPSLARFCEPCQYRKDKKLCF